MSKKKKTLMDYIDGTEENVVVQIYVPKSIFERTNEFRVKDKLTWKKLILASFDRYVEERKSER